MTPMQRKKAEQQAFCKTQVEPDRYGNFKWTDPDGRIMRIKFQKIVWRFEVKGTYGWARIHGMGYSDPSSMKALEHVFLIHPVAK